MRRVKSFAINCTDRILFTDLIEYEASRAVKPSGITGMEFSFEKRQISQDGILGSRLLIMVFLSAWFG